jgi:P-type Ca2+ transporter type 2C
MADGLTASEVLALRKVHGYNELPSAKPKGVMGIALEVMREPMFSLLLSCGLLYLLLGDYKEGALLFGSILLIIFITFYQYRKTENALGALKNLSAPRAMVVRDGEKVRIPGRDVVPGDVILLSEGDRVPADAELIESVNLTIDESMLTGESVAVGKRLAADETGKVFSGTLVVQGKGTAKATATGTATEFGKIGKSLQTIEQDETRLQREMKVLVRRLFAIGALVSVLIVVAFYITRGNFVQSLLNGLAAAMSILPEEFPVVLTVFLALGAWRLSKRNVLTRKPSAIETLGSATVLCTDKTGTLTQNRMDVVAVHSGGQMFEKDRYEDERNSLINIATAALNATQKESPDPMEHAVVHFASRLKIDRVPGASLIREYPLSPGLLAMTRVLGTHDEGPLTASCKGAPEAVFRLCRLDAKTEEQQLDIVHRLGTNGHRVIAVAHRTSFDGELPESQEGLDLEYLGLLAFEDPIRPEVPAAIEECRQAGISVIMITGDFPATAKSIAKQIGLPADDGVISGKELDAMSDDELKSRIRETSVFARVVPEQKLRIVKALKANHEVVAMTGDGVNDAPALKAADIGVAMGNKGTDVAREASSLVLLDDNFASIVGGIRLGRRIFDNLQKSMTYIIAIHVPIIGLTLIPAFFANLPLLLMPVHIVFLELIIDPICSIAFESEQEERGIMQRPPRDPDHRFFSSRRFVRSVFNGALLLIMVLVVAYLSAREGHTEGEIRAIAFSALIIGNIFLILTNLNKTRSFIASILERNVAVLFILGSAAAALLLIISVPALQSLFSFEFPGYRHFLVSLTGAAMVLLILEVLKFARRPQAAR